MRYFFVKRVYMFLAKRVAPTPAATKMCFTQLYLQVFVAIISPQYFPFCVKEAFLKGFANILPRAIPTD